ncbi:MAG: 4Fe-4S dicluster domain-containing protein [Myxococcota bacterium]
MSRAVLVDTTLCTGCRGCQVACKEENCNPPEPTTFFAAPGGYQNPARLSSKTFSLVTFNEMEDERGRPQWIFARRQCMHCEDPACASACLVGALEKQEDGSVTYDEDKCIGCRYCQLVCPFGAPALEWERPVAFIRKCNFCIDRVSDPRVPAQLNEGTGTPDVLEGEKRERHLAARKKPACVAACPTGALKHGERDELLREARQRIYRNPEKYVNHIYGEKEAGGTSWLYLASVPFDKLGFPANLGERSFPSYTNAAMGVVAPQVLGVGALLGGFYWFTRRRNDVAESESTDAKPAQDGDR